ncbi:conserved hypothetical protein [Peptoniphilus harei ACS-146-V-Sch2b]|uniref:Uncharacterized protein n=1 Tax=Peptoniphilus harei ACS-146-V-Sch2b TaxID=908338 RepID=E4KZH2_9FIRM|nr:conserved hypothetical protein [Peptoniphilus harei ACS-146-V-Sch2b]
MQKVYYFHNLRNLFKIRLENVPDTTGAFFIFIFFELF